MSTFFTSDLHLMHNFVSGLRGFDNHEDHDEAIINNINSMVSPDDDLWILGDLSLKKVDKFEHLFVRINGNKHVILGNHCSAHPMNRGWLNQWKALNKYCVFIGTNATIRLEGRTVFMQHFPTHGDGESFEEEDRCQEWRLPLAARRILLHGHTHRGDQRVHDRMIHVGLDAWDLKPVSQETIVKLIQDITAQSNIL